MSLPYRWPLESSLPRKSRWLRGRSDSSAPPSSAATAAHAVHLDSMASDPIGPRASATSAESASTNTRRDANMVASPLRGRRGRSRTDAQGPARGEGPRLVVPSGDRSLEKFQSCGPAFTVGDGRRSFRGDWCGESRRAPRMICTFVIPLQRHYIVAGTSSSARRAPSPDRTIARWRPSTRRRSLPLVPADASSVLLPRTASDP